MNQSESDAPIPLHPRYYEALGQAHDQILRCKDCQRLVVYRHLIKHARCICGNRRMMEITTLTIWEWVRIRLGLIRFAYRKEFLSEFNPIR